MSRIPRLELARITREVEAEFPGDQALQQVHIARKVIAYEAERSGISFTEYVGSSQRQRSPRSRRRVG